MPEVILSGFQFGCTFENSHRGETIHLLVLSKDFHCIMFSEKSYENSHKVKTIGTVVIMARS